MCIRDRYSMWYTDLRGQIKDHILIFGRIDYLMPFLQAVDGYSSQTVCFVSDEVPDDRWRRILGNFPKSIYLEASLSDPKEIRRTGIESAHHVVVLTWLVEGSLLQDFGMIPVVQLIEEHFPSVQLTIELIDERNMKFFKGQPNTEHAEHIPWRMWPKFAASEIFLSSMLDYVMAQVFHDEYYVDILSRLLSHHGGTKTENSRFNIFKVPNHYNSRTQYGALLTELVNKEPMAIPIALMRDRRMMDNEERVLIVNPAADTEIMKGDIVITIGERDLMMDEEALRRKSNAKKMIENLYRLKLEADEEDVKETTESVRDDLVAQVERITDEDETFEVKSDYIRSKIAADMNLSLDDVVLLATQNAELKDLVKEMKETSLVVMKRRWENHPSNSGVLDDMSTQPPLRGLFSQTTVFQKLREVPSIQQTMENPLQIHNTCIELYKGSCSTLILPLHM
eukprot:TRINITY_DN2619_c0_g2_i2.p1 TRINITY_DN2619_c0_g2~~TRINITY_DN2619_c0_g2_i2.p1  ORF type:complete len:453 (+),score=60.80 TRINITY_DN2619_c0_g2_i2:65-1423(+)